MDFNSDPKVPFPGVLDIGQFHSPHHREPAQSVCVADCSFIVNGLYLLFASPIAICR